MTTVELLTNPSPDVSTHVWKAIGVNELTRKNKLTSLPFWTPNSTTKRHQFRLIVLKGLVEGATEDADNYGILVELIPPPTDPDAEVDASHYPGGCSIAVKVKGANHNDVEQTDMSVFSSSNLQVSFPEMIRHAMLGDASYFNKEDQSMTIEVTIQTGLNSATVQVARTVSSLWSTLSSSVAQLLDKTSHIYHEARHEFEKADPTSAPPHPKGPLPWDLVPPRWATRAEAWRALVCENMVEDDGVFLYCPSALTSDQSTLLLSAGVSPHSVEGAYEQFDYDRDVHEGLLTNHQLAHQRYRLVPRKIPEESFWANYFWKIACVAQCENDTQVQAMLSVLNAPPLPQPKASTSGKATEDEIASLTRDAEEAASLLHEYLADTSSGDDAFLIEAAASTCEGHKNQLDPIFRRTDLSEATLSAVGAALRNVREQLHAYEAEKSRRKGVVAPSPGSATGPAVESTPVRRTAEETETPFSSSPPVPPPSTATTAQELAPSVEKAPGREPPATEEKPSAAALPSVATATPSPAVPPTTDGAATPAAPKTPPTDSARSASKASVEFPKMPWEDDDD